ncbi:MAG: YndJ family transporter [Myxococcota bacterium]
MREATSQDQANSTVKQAYTLWMLWTLFGVIAWFGTLFWGRFRDIAEISGLGTSLLLAPLVLVPLAIAMLCSTEHVSSFPRWSLWIAKFHPIAAFGACSSLFASNYGLAVLSAFLWTLQTLFLGVWGGWRLLRWRGGPLEEVAWHVGLMYASVGGLWWSAYTLQWEVMGFPPILTYLTAVHFHYAGFLVSASTALCGRWLRWQPPPSPWAKRLYRISAPIVMTCPILIALGFVFSPFLQFAMATALALGMLLLSIVIAFFILPYVPKVPFRPEEWHTRAVVLSTLIFGLFPLFLWNHAASLIKAAQTSGFLWTLTLLFVFILVFARLQSSLAAVMLLWVASIALTLTMFLAVVYALDEYNQTTVINIPQMAVWHGKANVYGFTLCSIIAWYLLFHTVSPNTESSPKI